MIKRAFGFDPEGVSLHSEPGTSMTRQTKAKGEAVDSMKLKWEGRWDQLKGKVKQTWGDMTDDDLDVAEGNYDELVGRIKEQTGETQEAIEDKLNA